MDLAGQIRLLEQILESDEPADPAELRQAINVPVIKAQAGAADERTIRASLECISTEVSRVQTLLRKQHQRNDELSEALRSYDATPAPKRPPVMLHREISLLAQKYLREHSGGSAEEWERVLLALVNACPSNEWVAFPTAFASVQFLVSEGLCMAEPAGDGMMRLRIW